MNNQNLNIGSAAQQRGLTGVIPSTAPEMEELQREIERMVQDGAAASGTVADAIGRDPASFVAHAARMLSVARSRRIRAEAIYQARRAQETIAFNERLLQLDRDHGKLIKDLSHIITKLEALRD